MSMRVVCQRCWERESSWTVNQASFHVGELQNWKVMLCERCALQVQMVLRAALQPIGTQGVVMPKDAA